MLVLRRSCCGTPKAVFLLDQIGTADAVKKIHWIAIEHLKLSPHHRSHAA